MTTFTTGPLPLSIEDDAEAWSAYWRSSVEARGLRPSGEPRVDVRSERVGLDGAEPLTACFVSGEVELPGPHPFPEDGSEGPWILAHL